MNDYENIHHCAILLNSKIFYDRLRTTTNKSTKKFKKVESASAMIWKLLKVAEKSFRRLKGHWLLPDVLEEKQFINGVAIKENKRVERKAA